MKSTGIVRKVDELGRIVIPIELRRILNVNEKDSLEIFTEGETIIFKKYMPGCVFCGEVKNTKLLKNISICQNCIDEIK
jgi:transcriptional pleiotropic regulator of transition state genes